MTNLELPCIPQTFNLIGRDETAYQLKLSQRDLYDDAMLHLCKGGQFAETAALEVDGIDTFDKDLEDLLLSLSAAKGTQISCDCVETVDGDGHPIYIAMRNSINRPYTNHRLGFIPSLRSSLEVRLTEPELQRSLDCWRKEDGLKRRLLVRHWLDSRIEDNYLEIRGVKYCTVLEHLKDLYEPGKNEFKERLKRSLAQLNITPIDSDLVTITTLRNCLIHEGKFLQPSDSSNLEQFFFLADFVDRIMLQVAGFTVTRS